MGEFLFEGCEGLMKVLFGERYPPVEDKPYCLREPINGKTLSVAIWEVLEDLRKTHDGERKRRVIILWAGLEDGRERTLDEIGREFNRSRETIRRIRDVALRQLRHPSRSGKLELYLEDSSARERAIEKFQRQEEKRRQKEEREEAKRKIWEEFLQTRKDLPFEEKQEEIRLLLRAYEKTSIGSAAPSPNRFINKIRRRGFLFRDLKRTEEELRAILDMPGTKTEQALLEMKRIANQMS